MPLTIAQYTRLDRLAKEDPDAKVVGRVPRSDPSGDFEDLKVRRGDGREQWINPNGRVGRRGVRARPSQQGFGL